jgi:hypothetical protein
MKQRHRNLLLAAWERLRGRPVADLVESLDQFFGTYFRSPLLGVTAHDYTKFWIDENRRTVEVPLSLFPDPPLLQRLPKSRHNKMLETKLR